MNRVKFKHLGQTGLKLDLLSLTVLIDPYLSNSVQELDSPDLERLIPIPISPQDLTEVDWVLITHDHLDHCDPHSMPVIAKASPNAQFMGPKPVRTLLSRWGIAHHRIHPALHNRLPLGSGLSVKAVLAAHPSIRMGSDGESAAVGWIFERAGRRVYSAGDTSVCEELIAELVNSGPIDTALLPVNEDNFFRRRRGIVGNMSIREAFHLAAEVGIKKVVPVHWDLFEANSALPAEIKAIYEGYTWPFSLLMNPEDIEL